ncbi:MAG TPA: hypothetical protein VL400_16610, partial [Polyangiaceae bacterium]|nr:hypothetical protein [Polyangiaceae bacterium]
MRRNQSSATRMGLVVAGALAVVLVDFPSDALAGPKKPAGTSADKGLELARTGDCVAAVPVLEKAETERHRPETAAALAGCHVALGDLVLALEIYAALADEPEDAAWSRADKKAHADADEQRAALDLRIPRLELSVTPSDADYTVKVAGRDLGKRRGPLPIPPDEKVDVKVEAEGFEPHTESIVLGEGEKKKVAVRLDRKAGASPPGGGTKPLPPAADPGPKGPKYWLGARFRGYLVPTFVMNIVVDGGTTTFLPGGEAT